MIKRKTRNFAIFAGMTAHHRHMLTFHLKTCQQILEFNPKQLDWQFLMFPEACRKTMTTTPDYSEQHWNNKEFISVSVTEFHVLVLSFISSSASAFILLILEIHHFHSFHRIFLVIKWFIFTPRYICSLCFYLVRPEMKSFHWYH